MLKYLKYDILRMKNIIIGFFVAIMILSVGMGITKNDLDKQFNETTDFYLKESKIRDKEYKAYEEKLEDPKISEEEKILIYEKIDKKSFEMARKEILSQKGYDIREVEKKINRTERILFLIAILIAISIALFIVYSILKFREDLFTDRGYLTFSLPIKTIDIIISKYITGIIIPMSILGLGFLIVNDIVGKERFLETEMAFYFSTTIVLFIGLTYMYLALSKIGNKFLEKMWLVNSAITACIIVVALLYSMNSYTTSMLESLKTISIPSIVISIFAFIMTERIIRKKLTI